MNIKGTTNSYVGYKGEVIAYIKRKGKQYEIPIHNSGTPYLTDTIALALSGNNVQQRLPAFIDIKYKTNDAQSFATVLRNKVDISARTFNAATYNVEQEYIPSSISIRAIITPADKDGTIQINNSDNTQMRLEMYPLPLTDRNAKEEEYLLASVICEGENNPLYQIYNAINEGTEAIIEWNMQFIIIEEQNKEGENV